MNRMCIRLLRPPGGPLAEPTTNWDDALVRLRLPSVAEVSIPLDDGVADERVKSIPTTLNGRPAARRSFWGVTRSCHGRVCRGKGGLGPTPLTCLAPPCADASTRTAPTPEEFAKVNRILKPQKKRQKRQRRRNGLLTLEAINRFGRLMRAMTGKTSACFQDGCIAVCPKPANDTAKLPRRVQALDGARKQDGDPRQLQLLVTCRLPISRSNRTTTVPAQAR